MTAKKKALPMRRDKEGKFSDSENFSVKERHEVRYAQKTAQALFSKHWLQAEFRPKEKVDVNVRTLVRLCEAVTKLADENKALKAQLKKK